MKARPLGVSLARFGSACAVCAALLSAAQGATLYWDADATVLGNSRSGAGLGGAGIWDNGITPNWWNGGTVDQAWNNPATDTAVFAGTAALVTLADPGVTAGNLIFNTSGYTLAGAAPTTTLTLAGTAPIINFNERSGATINTTISAKLGGANGLTFNGNGGTLTLNHAGTHTLTGTLKLHSGTVLVKGNSSVLNAGLGLTFGGTGTFTYDNQDAAGALTQNLGALALTAGEGTIRVDRSQLQNVTLAFASTTRSAGATGLVWANGFTPTLGGSVDVAAGGFGAGVTFVPGMYAKLDAAASGFAVYDATAGSFRLLNYNTDASVQTAAGGTSNITTANQFYRMTGSQSAQVSRSIFSLDIQGAFNLALAANETLTLTQGGAGTGSLLKSGGGASTISLASGSGGITTGNSSRELVVRTDAANDTLTISAPITNTGALTKTGNGTLTLTSGANAFSGTTYVNAGKLTLNTANGTGVLGSGAGVSLAGGTYEVLSDTGITTGKNVTVTGTSTLAVNKVSGSPTNQTFNFGTLSVGNQVFTTDPLATFFLNFTGQTTLADALRPTFVVTGTQAAGTTAGLQLAGVVANGGGVTPGLIKRGSGTLELANSGNTFGGLGAIIEVQAGLLSIPNAGALGNVNNAVVLNTLSASEGLVATGGAAIAVDPAHELILAQSANLIDVNGAATDLRWAGAISNRVAGTLTKAGAGTLTLSNSGSTFGTSGPVTLDLTAGNLVVTATGALGTVSNTVNVNTTGKISFAFPGIGGITVGQTLNFASTNNTLEINDGTSLTLSGQITSPAATTNITKTGLGNLLLTNAANTFGGPTGGTLDIQGGNLTVTSGGALGSPTNTIKLTQNGTTDKFVADGTSVARQAFMLAQPAGTNSIFEVTNGNYFTLSGDITGTGTNFVKTGGGTLIFGSGSSNFGGAGRTIDIQGGVLGATDNPSLGDAANTVTLNDSTGLGGFRALGTFTSNRTFVLAQASNTIEVDQGNALTLSTAFTRILQTNGLVKTGLGTLSLTAANTGWTGTITVDAGAIRVGNAASLGSAIGVGANTIINGAGGLELATSTVTEPITFNTPGDGLTMAGPNLGGVLRAASGTTTVSGAMTVNGSSTNGATRGIVFGGNSGTTLTLSGPLAFAHTATTGTMNLILAGEGTTDNTLSGAVTITNGGTVLPTLVKAGTTGTKWVIAPSVVPAIGAIRVQGGTLQENAAAAGGSGTGAVLPVVPLSFDSTGTFVYHNVGTTAGSNKSQTLGALNLIGGDATIQINRQVAVNTNLTFGALNRTEGATALFSVTGTGAAFATTTKIALTPEPAAGFMDVGLFATPGVSPATAGSFAWYDTTAHTIRAINYTTDGVTVARSTGGTNVLNAVKHWQLTGSDNAQTTATISSLNLQGSSSVTLANGATLTISNGGGDGGILKTGFSAATIGVVGGGSASLTAGAGNELVVRPEGLSDSLTITVPIVNTGALTKSGLGTLTLSGANGWTGPTAVNGGVLVLQGTSALAGSAALTLAGGTLTLQFDGDGTASFEPPFVTGKDLTVSATSGVTVGRKTGTTSGMNKVATFNSLTLAGVIFSTTTAATEQYGVEITGPTTLTDALPATFNVTSVNAQPSNVVAGLTLSGVVSSANSAGISKTDVGTLVLGNAGNTFGGVGSQINIRRGFVAAASDGALGHLGNDIILATPTENEGFRATGTFATDRSISLNTATNGIEVTQGNVLTLNQALNIASLGNALTKGDNGVLEFGADNPSLWTGTITLKAGAIRLKTGGGLGGSSRALTVSNPGTALQLSGAGVAYNPYSFTFSGTGINSGGALENVSGNNTWLGTITLGANATVGATAGSLTLAGSVSAASALTLTLAGAGDTILNAGVAGTNLTLIKTGTGTATIAGASSSYVQGVTVNGGTFRIRGSGALLGAAGSTTVTVNQGARLVVDDSVGAPVAARLGGRAVTLNAGAFEFQGSSSAASAQTAGALTIGAGGNRLSVERGLGQTNTLTFSSGTNALVLGNGDASLAVTGAGLGSPENRIISSGGVTGISNGILPRVTVNGADFGVYANAQDNLDASSTADSNIVTLTSGSTAQLVVGQLISGNANIPAGARVASVASSNIFTIDMPAIGTATSQDTDFALGGLAAFASYERALDINLASVAATETYLINEFTNINNPITASKTIAALKMDAANAFGGSLTLPGNPLTTLTLNSGAILATGGLSNITVPVVAFGGAQGVVHVNAGSQLVIGSSLTGTAGFVKAGDGLLTLNASPSAVAGLGGNTALTGTYNLNAGTLRLGNAPGTLDNLLATNVAFRIGAGATLDLHGNLQYFGPILTPGAVSGTGGALGQVISSSGNGTLVTNLTNAARDWSANITGPVSFARSGQNTLTIYSPQPYTGATLVNGGTTTLRDGGTFEATSALDVNYATLILDNATGTTDAGNRLGDGAVTRLRGGVLTLAGRPQTESRETTGALTIANGLSTITVHASSGAAITGVSSAQLTFSSLTRQPGATVNFAGQINAVANNLGLIGNNPRVVFTAAPTLTNNLIGPWAITTGVSSIPEFASYVPGLGVGPLGGFGFPKYDNTTDLSTATVTDNVRLLAAPTVSAATVTVNSLNVIGAFTPGISFAAPTNTLNLVSGGLIRSGATAAHDIGAVAAAGKLTSGGTAAGLSELTIYQGNSTQTLSIFSKIIDNGTVGASTALILSGTGTVAMAAQTSNTYTGGTTVDGIAVNTTGAVAGMTVFPNAADPAKGLVISGSTVSFSQPGQIGSGNVVTLNGPSTLNLFGDYQLAGLAFNNTGGTGTPVVNSFTNNTPSSKLSIGALGVTATATNIATTATIAGRMDIGSGTPFYVEQTVFNGQDISPSQATLAVQGIVDPSGGNGGIIKTGTGILQFNAQATYTGGTQVNAGGIQYGGGNAGSRFSTVTLGGATSLLNLNGNSTVIGGLAGNGVVTNASNTDATLTVGFNDASTVFSGQLRGISDGNQNSIFFNKIGSGTLDFTGFSDSTGDLSTRGGVLRYSGVSGVSSFTNDNLLQGGTLTLDNTAANVNSRLGGSAAFGTLNMNGGALNLIGNSAAPTIETVRTFNKNSGASVITLTPNLLQSLTLRVGTSFSGANAGGTVLIRGLSDTIGAGKANFDGGAPSINFNPPAGAGNGNPPSQLAIRPDLIGDESTTGTGTGFLTKDGATGLIRLLVELPSNPATELENVLVSGSTTPTNYRFSALQNITENTTAYSVVFAGNAGIQRLTPASHGVYGPNGTVFTQLIRSGGILTTAGASSVINVGLLQTGVNVPLFFHTVGNLSVTGDLSSGSGGMTKSGAGTLTLNSRGLYTGPTAVNEGTVTLTGPLANNNIAVIPGAITPILSQLVMNGGTLDLSGKSQVFAQFTSNNPNAGFGGTITNSGALATFTTATAAGSTYSGSISSALNFEKQGAATLTLTAPSPYTGTTTIRGGLLNLTDLAALPSTSSISVANAELRFEQRGLNLIGDLDPIRVNPNTPIDMFGATFQMISPGSVDSAATIGVGAGINILGGANAFIPNVPGSTGSSLVLTLGNLVRGAGNYSTVNLGNSGGTLGSLGINNPRMFVNQFNGGGLTLTNDLIGAWAISNSNFATVKGTGPYEIGGIGIGNGFAGYASTNISTATAAQNVNDSAARTISSLTTANTWRIALNNVVPVTTTLNSTLTLAAGGLLANLTGSTTTNNITTPTNYIINGSGSLTSGSNEFYIHAIGSTAANTLSVQVPITGGVGMSLIKSGSGTLEMTAVNTYGGDTVVQQGVLQLDTPGANPNSATPVPANLLINNATTTLLQANQLRATAQVTLDGSSTLNMSGPNVISRLVFNHRGGNANPTVNTSNSLELTSASPITATSDTFSSTPLIQGSELKLTNAAPTISTSGLSANQLAINAPIHVAGGSIENAPGNGPLTKSGSGALSLNPTLGAITSTTTSGSRIITDLVSNAAMEVGMLVTGSQFPAGTTIVKLFGSGTAVLVSKPATANGNGVGLTYTGSTFNSGLNHSGGLLLIGQNSALFEGDLTDEFGDPTGLTLGTIADGPIGSGTLTLAHGTAIASDNTLRTLHNPVQVNGNFAFGTPVGSTATALLGGGLNLAGTVTFSPGAHSIDVNSVVNTSTISGQILAGSSTLTKTGPGTLVLANSSNVLSSSINVAGGVLKSGALGAVTDGINLTVSTGAVFDTNAFEHVFNTLSGDGIVANSSTGATTVYVGGTSRTDTTSNVSSNFTGSIAGTQDPFATLGLTKVGAGVLLLSGDNSYRGETNVDSGMLRVAASGRLSGGSLVNVNPGGWLDNNGTITAGLSGNVTALGDPAVNGPAATISGFGTFETNVTMSDNSILRPTVGPGNTKMTIAQDQSLFMDDGSTLFYIATTASIGNRINVGQDGNVLLVSAGTWTLKLENFNVADPKGMEFVLFDGNDASFNLLNFNSFGTDDVGNYVIDFGTTGWSLDPAMGGDAGVHFDLDTNNIVVRGLIPEPSSSSMLAGGLAVMLGWHRLRRRRAS